MSLISRSMDSLRRRGLRRSLQTLLSMVDDWWFDRRHGGLDTMGRRLPHELQVDSPNRISGHAYVAMRGRIFRRLFRSLPLPRRSVFVDYGSGKGKALMLAAEFGFSRIVGIEYARDLHEVAVDNLRRFGARRPHAIELVCADAAKHELRDDENVFYFFNPFERDVLDEVIERIRESLERRPRHVWVVYFDARFPEAFQSRLGLRRSRAIAPYGGIEGVVLENEFPVVLEAATQEPVSRHGASPKRPRRFGETDPGRA